MVLVRRAPGDPFVFEFVATNSGSEPGAADNSDRTSSKHSGELLVQGVSEEKHWNTYCSRAALLLKGSRESKQRLL